MNRLNRLAQPSFKPLFDRVVARKQRENASCSTQAARPVGEGVARSQTRSDDLQREILRRDDVVALDVRAREEEDFALLLLRLGPFVRQRAQAGARGGDEAREVGAGEVVQALGGHALARFDGGGSVVGVEGSSGHGQAAAEDVVQAEGRVVRHGPGFAFLEMGWGEGDAVGLRFHDEKALEHSVRVAPVWRRSGVLQAGLSCALGNHGGGEDAAHGSFAFAEGFARPDGSEAVPGHGLLQCLLISEQAPIRGTETVRSIARSREAVRQEGFFSPAHDRVGISKPVERSAICGIEEANIRHRRPDDGREPSQRALPVASVACTYPQEEAHPPRSIV